MQTSVYLDNAATSFPKPEVVHQAVSRCMREVGASSGRGAYKRALQADRIVSNARGSLGRLFGIGDTSRIVFTSNATESINLAIKGLLQSGDHVITTSMEHNGVWRCLKTMKDQMAISLSVVECSREGFLDPDDIKARIRPNTRLIVMLHASNVTGTIMPVDEVGRVSREYGVPFLVDAAQTAGTYPVDVNDLNIDLLAFTGHKGLLGPQGTGGLYIREGIHLRTLKEGGTGSESSLERQPDTMPDRFEAGTLNVPGIAGLGAGVEYILAMGVEHIRNKEHTLTSRGLEALRQAPLVTLYGPQDPDKQVGIISLNLAGARPHEVAYILDEVYGIMVRAGLHCAPCAHRTMGTGDRGTLRIGFGQGNTLEDVDYFVRCLGEIGALT